MVEDTPTQYLCLHERGQRHIWVRRQANNKVLQQNSKWTKKMAIETSWFSRGWEGTIDKSGNVIACHCCIFHGLIFTLSHSPSLFSSLSSQVFPNCVDSTNYFSGAVSHIDFWQFTLKCIFLSENLGEKCPAGGGGQDAGFVQPIRENLHCCVL